MHIFNMLGNYNDTLCIDSSIKCLWEPYSRGKGKEIKQQFTNALFIDLYIYYWAYSVHYFCICTTYIAITVHLQYYP